MNKKIKDTLISAASITALGFAIYENYSIETDEYIVSSKKIPKEFNGFRILQLSDFHSKNYGFDNKYLIEKIEETNPDIIIMTGDMVSREDKTLDTFYGLAKAIGTKYDVYYIIGNHELDICDEKLRKMFRILRKFNIHILDNEKVSICRGNSAIDLYGMWYALRYYKDDYGNYRNPMTFDIVEMTRLLGKKASDNYSILLAHNPLVFPVYAEWGADLTFSGHIHGGVIRLGRFGGLFSPGRRLFPKYYAGEYYSVDKELIVSRGIGGLRMLNRPNLVVAILKSEQ